ncbi:Zinc finger CCCH domain-containing protein [Ranunculus cassubicifolius]
MQVPLNVYGLPMRQDEKPCPYYMRTWSCKFGIACKFHHPQPAGVGTMLPGSGPIWIYRLFSSIFIGVVIRWWAPTMVFTESTINTWFTSAKPSGDYASYLFSVPRHHTTTAKMECMWG